VRGGIDQPPGAAGPDHIPGPEVAVDAARRLRRAGQVGRPGRRGLDQPRIRAVQRPRVHGQAQVGQHPAGGVPVRPRVPASGRGGYCELIVWQEKTRDEPWPRCTERGRASPVHPGQFPAEPLRRGGVGRPGRHPGDDQRGVVPAEHLGHADRARLAEPAQAAGLGLEHPAQAGPGDLRECGPAIGQHGPVVRPAVLRPGGPQFPHDLAGDALDPLGAPAHVRGCAGSPSNSASWPTSPRAPASTRSSASA